MMVDGFIGLCLHLGPKLLHRYWIVVPAIHANITAKSIRVMERDLARKEKALAEAAALMILRKKAEAIWGRAGEDE